MDSDTSWYEEGQNHFENKATTSGTQRGRPPDTELVENKTDEKNIIEEVSLVDDEDDAEEAVNSFCNMTRKNILLPFTGVEIQDELKFLEAIKQFKMILEQKIEVLTLKQNLKEVLYKYLLFFGTNYERIGILYRDQYLDVMENILLFYCDVIKEYFKEIKRRDKKLKVMQEARRIKVLFRVCMLKQMDRIFHVLLKVRLAPEMEEHRRLWSDVYVYFLTKASKEFTDEDMLRGYITFQKLKTIRKPSEDHMIDQLMHSEYKKSEEDLRRIPCLGEIMDRKKRDKMYTVRDMITRYMRYYKEKKRQTERFEMDDFDEDTEDTNINEMRRLDLSNSFPSKPTSSNLDSPAVQIFVDRRRGSRRTVLDLAADSNSQFDQFNSSEFELFDDAGGPKKETPEDAVVVLDDDEEDDVIVVCDNLKTVITIEDDDEEEPVPIQPTKSPPPRDALSPDKMLQPPESQSMKNSGPVESQPSNEMESRGTSQYQSSPLSPMDVDTIVPSRSPMSTGNPVPDKVLPTKEPLLSKDTPLSSTEKFGVLVPKWVQIEKQLPTRQVKEVHNSLKITIQSLPLNQSTPNISSSKSSDSVSTLNLDSEQVESQQCQSRTCSIETPSRVDDNKKQLVVESEEPQEVLSPEAAESVSTSLDKNVEEYYSQNKQNVTSNLVQEERSHLNSLGFSESPLTSNIYQPDLQKESQLAQPKQSEELYQTALEKEPCSDKSSSKTESNKEMKQSKANLSQIIYNECIMDVEASKPTNTSGLLESIASSTMDEENVPLMTTSLSPIIKENISGSETDKAENKSYVIMKPPAAELIGVLPSSKIPSDLEDSPNTSPEKNSEKCAALPHPHIEITRRGVLASNKIPSDMEDSPNSSPDKNNKDFPEPLSPHIEVKPPIAKRTGLLPSSKIPSDLEDSPNSSPEKSTEKSTAPLSSLIETETSNISSPSFESIDKTEAKKYFAGRKPCPSNNESEISKTNNDSSNPTTPTCETDVTTESVTTTSPSTCTESDTSRNDSSTDSFKKSCEIVQEKMITLQVEERKIPALKFDKELGENKALRNGVELQLQKASRKLKKPRNYSNLTECFTKFTDELSAEDILASHSEDLASSAENLTTIDLVPSTENAKDVIIVKCRPIEPLKDEENMAPGAETMAFSADEVLAPSNEAVALLVTYPSSSQEESQHFLMCDANLALSNEQLSFSSDEMTDRLPLATNKIVPQLQRETIDGLSLSGSQPYTPQSSPSTRIDTVRPDINRVDDLLSSRIDVCLNNSTESTSHHQQTVSSPYSESAIIQTTHLNENVLLQNTSKPLEVTTSIIQAPPTALPKPTEISLTASKPKYIPDLPERTDRKNRDTTGYTVEDFREDLSKSIRSAKRITPQEVDKINQLPLRYSQELWSDRTQQKPEISETNLFSAEKPATINLLQQKTTTLLTTSDSLQTSSSGSPSQQNLKFSKSELTSVNAAAAAAADNQTSILRSASFVEDKLNELYIKEYGNNLSKPDSRLTTPSKIQSKRRHSHEAPPIRSTKIFAKGKPNKDILSQPKERDTSLKTYKALIKNVTKRRTNLLRDVANPLQKEELEGISQLHLKNLKISEDICDIQPKNLDDSAKGSSIRDAHNYDHNELFNNGMEGPIGKPMGGMDVEDNFFWDIDNDGAKEDAFSGTISVKPDSQLYQIEKTVVTPKKSLVSNLKSSRPPKGENSFPDQKSPEKKVTFSDKTEIGLYVKLDPIDIESYQRDLKRKITQANELKKKQQRQISLAQEMREKQQQSLQRDQILIQIYSEKPAEPANWFTKAKAKLSSSPKASSLANSNVSSRDESHFMKGKTREQVIHRNGHKVTEKRKNRDFDSEGETPRKKVAINTDLMDRKPKNSVPNGKAIAPKLKSIMKSAKVTLPVSLRGLAIDENDRDEGPSSPVKMTKSGRVCKKPRPDYDDVIKGHFNGSSKVKKTVKFKL